MAGLGTVITAMITPFDEELQIDLDKMEQLTEKLIQLGSDGLLVTGTTGESPTLTVKEKLSLYERVIKTAVGRVPVMAGTGSNNTQQSIELTKKAEALGADAIMLVTPYYNKPPQDALYTHFSTVAAATSLPVMIYNVPGRTSRNIEAETVARLAEIDNIVAIKEASGNMDQVSEIRRLTPPDFTIYSGDDSLTLPIMAIGGKGVVSVASHLVADRIQAMVRAFKRGQVEEAAICHKALMPVFKAMFITTNPIPLKAALKLSGFDVGGLRLPLSKATEKEVEVIRQVLAKAELL
ncbi:MAG: 4-hydroxy-tetrahydrodipicolinate synthase [Firmicutes bacterium]|nr:4-hydroxy-tetrahydrodipicolinate synthase [Bacillota bacterium]